MTGKAERAMAPRWSLLVLLLLLVPCISFQPVSISLAALHPSTRSHSRSSSSSLRGINQEAWDIFKLKPRPPAFGFGALIKERHKRHPRLKKSSLKTIVLSPLVDLKRSEKVFKTIEKSLDSAARTGVTPSKNYKQYIVSARFVPPPDVSFDTSVPHPLSDWVPAAALFVAEPKAVLSPSKSPRTAADATLREDEDANSAAVESAIRHHRRAILAALCVVVPKVKHMSHSPDGRKPKQLDAQYVEYGYEDVNSFQSFVYEKVVQAPSKRARGVDKESELAALKVKRAAAGLPPPTAHDLYKHRKAAANVASALLDANDSNNPLPPLYVASKGAAPLTPELARKILRLPEKFTAVQLKRNYRMLAAAFHPDQLLTPKSSSEADLAAPLMRSANVEFPPPALPLLHDGEERREYTLDEKQLAMKFEEVKEAHALLTTSAAATMEDGGNDSGPGGGGVGGASYFEGLGGRERVAFRRVSLASDEQQLVKDKVAEEGEESPEEAVDVSSTSYSMSAKTIIQDESLTAAEDKAEIVDAAVRRLDVKTVTHFVNRNCGDLLLLPAALAEDDVELKKNTKKKDPDSKKKRLRGKSSYNFFCDAMREEVKSDLGGEAKLTEVNKELGLQWARLKASLKLKDKNKVEKFKKMEYDDREVGPHNPNRRV